MSADLLRAWEKRYQAVSPRRSATGRRIYSDADVERLRLIKDAISAGRRIGDVAALTTAEIERLVGEDVAERRAHSADDPGDDAEALLDEAIAAVRRADQPGVHAILSRALLTRSPGGFMVGVATPFMQRIVALWADGEISPAHEHAASEVVRRLMHELLGMLRPSAEAPGLVAATPSGQRHEIGALFAAVAAALDGWRVTYLGSDLPAVAIGRVAVSTEASAIALSVTTEAPELAAFLAALRKSVGRRVPILVGGRQVASIATSTRGVDAVADLDAFAAALRAIAAAQSAAAT